MGRIMLYQHWTGAGNAEQMVHTLRFDDCYANYISGFGRKKKQGLTYAMKT